MTIYFFWAYERGNESYADRLNAGLREAIENLTAFPLMGVARDQWEPGFRVLFREEYVILYTYDEVVDAVVIRNVLHGQRDIGSRYRDQ